MVNLDKSINLEQRRTTWIDWSRASLWIPPWTQVTSGASWFASPQFATSPLTIPKSTTFQKWSCAGCVGGPSNSSAWRSVSLYFLHFSVACGISLVVLLTSLFNMTSGASWPWTFLINCIDSKPWHPNIHCYPMWVSIWSREIWHISM